MRSGSIPRAPPCGPPMESSVCSNSFQQIFPAAALNRSYHTLVAWSDGRNLTHDVYAQKLDLSGVPAVDLLTASRWGRTPASTRRPPVVISDAFGGPFLPGGWIVGWIADDGTKREVRVQHVDSDGGLLTPAGNGGVQITSHTQQVQSLAMVTDGLGTTTSGAARCSPERGSEPRHDQRRHLRAAHRLHRRRPMDHEWHRRVQGDGLADHSGDRQRRKRKRRDRVAGHARRQRRPVGPEGQQRGRGAVASRTAVESRAPEIRRVPDGHGAAPACCSCGGDSRGRVRRSTRNASMPTGLPPVGDGLAFRFAPLAGA